MEARQPFSRLGWALFAQMAVMLAAQWGVLLLGRGGTARPAGRAGVSVGGVRPGGLRAGDSRRLSGAVGDGGPARPGPPPAGAGPLRGPLAGSVGLAYLANGGYPAPHRPAGAAPGRGGGQPGGVHRPLPPFRSSSCWPGLIAPAAEELLFRRLLLRRLRPYGERFALVASALCFGLFHGNLNQFFYAFLLGLVLAELALSTGCLWQAVLLHALVNLLSILWVGWAARWW